MRWHFVASFSLVLLNHTQSVDRSTSIWIDDDAEQSRVCLYSNNLPSEITRNHSNIDEITSQRFDDLSKANFT